MISISKLDMPGCLITHLEGVCFCDDLGASPHRHNGSGVHEVHQLGTREARGGPGNLVVVQALFDLFVSGVHLQNSNTPLHSSLRCHTSAAVINVSIQIQYSSMNRYGLLEVMQHKNVIKRWQTLPGLQEREAAEGFQYC